MKKGSSPHRNERKKYRNQDFGRRTKSFDAGPSTHILASIPRKSPSKIKPSVPANRQQIVPWMPQKSQEQRCQEQNEKYSAMLRDCEKVRELNRVEMSQGSLSRSIRPSRVDKSGNLVKLARKMSNLAKGKKSENSGIVGDYNEIIYSGSQISGRRAKPADASPNNQAQKRQHTQQSRSSSQTRSRGSHHRRHQSIDYGELVELGPNRSRTGDEVGTSNKEGHPLLLEYHRRGENDTNSEDDHWRNDNDYGNMDGPDYGHTEQHPYNNGKETGSSSHEQAHNLVRNSSIFTF